MAHVIGIDLGTTYSCVAYMEETRPKVIPNLEGLNTTPSVVSFTSTGQRLIGNLAQRQAITNPEHTVYAVKRLIGRKFESSDVQQALTKVPYQIVAAPNGDTMISIESRKITPQEISAMILSYLKKCAESHFGEKVNEAVITVPAHFNDAQRQATKDAAQIAGLDVLRVINEPTAASLAYGLDSRSNATIAVFDLGGGTFDITILEISDGVFHVLATNGDSYLGGEDFDNRIVDWLIEEFKQENGIELSKDKLALQRIKEAAERAKRELSFTLESEINLPFICSGPQGSKHLNRKLNRSNLEKLTVDLANQTIPMIERTLQEARLTSDQIQEIILVGGQTRMPLIRKTIEEFFRKKPKEDINPDEIVAMGAAVQSGIIVGQIDELVLLLDVTPLSLGIETENGMFQKIIDKNMTIPTRKTMSFTTVEDNQPMVKVHVLQGESPIAKDNKSLAHFDLVGVEPAPAGVPQIDVTFEITADGLVTVSAQDKASGMEQQIDIRPSSGLSKKEMDLLTLDNKKREEQDRKNDKTGLL